MTLFLTGFDKWLWPFFDETIPFPVVSILENSIIMIELYCYVPCVLTTTKAIESFRIVEICQIKQNKF